MSSRRILAVSYYFPPNPLAGGHRWEAMSHALRGLGHEVTVLTTSASGTLPDDAPWVVRSGDLQASESLRRLLRRPRRGAPTVAEEMAAPPRLLARGLVPDSWVATWLPYVTPLARRLIRERAIEAVVTNGPPESTHLLGLLLGRRRPAWIADFDDGWRYEPIMGGWPTRAQDRIDAALERRVVRSADAVVAITEPIAADFSTRLGVAPHEIPSGWDPQRLDADVAAAQPPALAPGVVNVVHTGALSVPERRDPRILFEAIERLVAEDPTVSERLRLTLAGTLTAEDRSQIERLSPAARAMVDERGFLPKPGALALQRAADVLLLISNGPHRQVITAKLPEYLLANRPILAVLAENEAARIVRSTGTGIVVGPQDADALIDALRACLDGRLASAFDPHGVERYVQPNPAREFAAVIEAAIERRAGGRA